MEDGALNLSPAPPVSSERLLVAVSGSASSEYLVEQAAALAKALRVPWEAIHIETPERPREGAAGIAAAEALRLAAKLGATISSIPAATVVGGLCSHLEVSPTKHLVLGARRESRYSGLLRRSLFDALVTSRPDLVLHLYRDEARSVGAPLPALANPAERAPLRSYALAALAVFAILLLAEALQLFLGTRPLDLLFLFPVIAVAARLGLGPAIFAVALSVALYNYFLLMPVYSFNPAAPQNIVMTGVLVAVAVYTSVLTTTMRGRLVLSDRSAQENASLAALAQQLTRDADWEATARTVCEHVRALFDVETVIFREVAGKLILAAATMDPPRLSPVDQAALELAWKEGKESGAGTSSIASADWQFQPLKTSLGVLAVLGLAREDGRNPVRADRRILLLTLVAQAALAHERLRLEDLILEASRSAAKAE